MIKILTVIDYSSQSERRLLQGLVSYADAHGGCILYPMSNIDVERSGHSRKIVSMARSLQVDAIYGVWYDIDVQAALSLGIPIFVRTNYKVYKEISMATGNYQRIGRIAADFFLHQHYDRYAFLGLKDIIWSEQRLEGFADRLGERDLSVATYKADDVSREWTQITAWLRALPKPVALFTCNDAMARHVTEICLPSGIRIPDELALLGVDDDEFLCNISYPSISSIRLDFEKQGWEIGRAIFEMVGRGQVWVERVPIEPVRIVERMSTRRQEIQDAYVKQIAAFFEDHYQEAFSLDEALAAIPLSRRAIEIRFKKEMAPMTMLSYLETLRISQFRRLLRTTDLSIKEAAARSGFSDSTNVARLFRKYEGCTPSQYRNDHRE
ncbi:MAG: substrate-binding domain-containing protein [Bacteroidales bacterium]|nr:substrate-binding domain-containing protein [Bacteroidales bacterium]